MNTTANTFPALAGDVVTERHARTCREQGHATHTIDGVDTGVCPRCGEVTLTAADVATFERILDLEAAARCSSVAGSLQLAGVSNFRNGQMAESAAADKARLDAAIDALTPAQMLAFGQYRNRA